MLRPGCSAIPIVRVPGFVDVALTFSAYLLRLHRRAIRLLMRQVGLVSYLVIRLTAWCLFNVGLGLEPTAFRIASLWSYIRS